MRNLRRIRQCVRGRRSGALRVIAGVLGCQNNLMAESANGCECESVSMPGACSCGDLLAFCDDGVGGSLLIIKDLDLYPQPPRRTPGRQILGVVATRVMP